METKNICWTDEQVAGLNESIKHWETVRLKGSEENRCPLCVRFNSHAYIINCRKCPVQIITQETGCKGFDSYMAWEKCQHEYGANSVEAIEKAVQVIKDLRGFLTYYPEVTHNYKRLKRESFSKTEEKNTMHKVTCNHKDEIIEMNELKEGEFGVIVDSDSEYIGSYVLALHNGTFAHINNGGIYTKDWPGKVKRIPAGSTITIKVGE